MPCVEVHLYHGWLVGSELLDVIMPHIAEVAESKESLLQELELQFNLAEWSLLVHTTNHCLRAQASTYT